MSAVIKIICNIVIFSTNFFFPETLEMCPTPPILKCWACPATPKYKCPKCNIKSCSLDCVKRHKEEANCDGEKSKHDEEDSEKEGRQRKQQVRNCFQ